MSKSATTRRTRAGTLSSPRPGSNITIVPMRANISMKTAASVGKNETSIRIARVYRLCPAGGAYSASQS